MNAYPTVTVIGAGLAGTEAALQIAKAGVPVVLYEMKPGKMTPAHHSPDFAELVCSNSLRSAQIENAVGLLKEELRRLGSFVMDAADKSAVPAGAALAVDRKLFSADLTARIENNPLIEIRHEELTEIPAEGIVVVATGPLTSDGLSDYIAKEIAGTEGQLHFYDAAAPIVTAESINMDKAFRASRYEKGSDYINCPMTMEEYDAFWTDERVSKAKALGLSKEQVSTVASIVAGETRAEQEFAKIAGVYLNRYNIGMRLQADPTVCYCYGYTLNRVLLKHLEVDSPYNTYKYAGLPPGPICTPGKAYLDAVLNPDKHGYLYFCASASFDGTHNFAVSYDQHLRNAREFQTALNARNKARQ